MDSGRWIPADGFRQMDSGRWIPADGFRQMDSGRWMPADGFRQMDSGRWIPADGFRQMDSGRWIPANGRIYPLSIACRIRPDQITSRLGHLVISLAEGSQGDRRQVGQTGDHAIASGCLG